MLRKILFDDYIISRCITCFHSFNRLYPPPLLCKSFFSPSAFFLFHDYQVLSLPLCGKTLRSFGREPVSRTEQRTECKFFFFFLSFFRVISFPTNNNFSLVVRQYTKERCASPTLLLLLLLLSRFAEQPQRTFFFSNENANNGSQHLRDMLPFFRSLFFIFISFFRYTLSVSSVDVIVNVTYSQAFWSKN